MKKVMVRYKLKSDKVEENIQLVKSVFEELRHKSPDGIRYITFTLPDGVSFIHLASIETLDGSNPLPTLNAFKIFSQDIGDRCEEPPVVTQVTEIGSYKF